MRACACFSFSYLEAEDDGEHERHHGRDAQHHDHKLWHFRVAVLDDDSREHCNEERKLRHADHNVVGLSAKRQQVTAEAEVDEADDEADGELLEGA